MRRALFLLIVAAILIAGGYLSTAVSKQGPAAIPGLWIQTNNPDASVLNVNGNLTLPFNDANNNPIQVNKAVAFVIFVTVVMGSLIGLGVVLALVFWFLNRQAQWAKQMPNEGFDFTMNPAKPNSLGGTVTHHPGIVAGLVLLVVIALSILAAISSGVFLHH